MTLCRLFYIAVLRCVLRLASRRYSRERNPIGCDGVEDNKPSPQNRECAFTEISTRGDFYAFFRRHRSDARQKKLATMSPIGTESAKNLFCAHLGVSRSRLRRPRETRPNGSKLTYAFQNLKRRSRPIQSGDFAAHLRSLIRPFRGSNFCCFFLIIF